LVFWGISPQKWGAVSIKKPQEAHLRVVAVLAVINNMSLSATVSEKSRGNKKCDKEEEEEERHIFGLFGIAVKWPRHGCMQFF